MAFSNSLIGVNNRGERYLKRRNIQVEISYPEAYAVEEGRRVFISDAANLQFTISGDFAMSFEIEAPLNEEKKVQEIKIRNVGNYVHSRIAGRSRYLPEGARQRFRLMAGYGEDLHVLCTGDVLRVDGEWKHPDHITTILIADEVNIKERQINVNLRSPTFRDALQEMARAVGVPLGSLGNLPDLDVRLEPTSFNIESFGDAMDKLLDNAAIASHGFDWTFHCGILRVYRTGNWEREAGLVRENVTISEETGMIGRPTNTEEGIEVSMLLNPDIGIEQLVYIRSSTFTGWARVKELHHKGDNWDSNTNFETMILAEPTPVVGERKIEEVAPPPSVTRRTPDEGYRAPMNLWYRWPENIKPIPGAWVTAPFGQVRNLDQRPFNQFEEGFINRTHQGIDLVPLVGDSHGFDRHMAAPPPYRGWPIRAAKSGTVIAVGEGDPIQGNFVVISHDDDFTTQYWHLDTTEVEQGQEVRSGERIGTMGSTGASVSDHLHFEIRNEDNVHVNPKLYFSRHSIIEGSSNLQDGP